MKTVIQIPAEHVVQRGVRVLLPHSQYPTSDLSSRKDPS
jgi:hypothetical protein